MTDGVIVILLQSIFSFVLIMLIFILAMFHTFVSNASSKRKEK